MHIGGAVSGTLWYALYVALLAPAWLDGEFGYDDVSVTLAGVVLAVLLAMCVLATPGFRTRHHDVFEASHRFGTWAVLLLAWANALVLAHAQLPVHGFGEALLRSPIFWVLTVSTALAVWPWLLLRRIPIAVDTPSSHAAIVLRLDDSRVPPVGTTRPISRHPLLGWHPFACVPAPADTTGYRMVVIAGGRVDRRFHRPPAEPRVGARHPDCRSREREATLPPGALRGDRQRRRPDPRPPAGLLWVTKEPHAAYGTDLVDEIRGAARSRDLEHH